MAPWLSSSRRGSQVQIQHPTNSIDNTSTSISTNASTSASAIPSVISSVNSSVNSSSHPRSHFRSHSHANTSDLSLASRIHNTALHTPTTLPGRFNSNFRFDISNVHADSSSDDDNGLHPPKPKTRRPQHSRSMSQPFPSLFSSKGKKKRQNSIGNPPPPDLGFADDDAANMPRTKPLKGHTRGGPSGPSGSSKDFATGNCMTCGSLVWWPKELQVFKCTICTSVNDLVPLGSESQSNGGSNACCAPRPRVQPISLDQTRRLARQCIRSHLTRKLCSLKKRPVESNSPPRDRSSSRTRVHATKNNSDQSDASKDGATSGERPAINAFFDEEPTLRPKPNPFRVNTPPGTRSFSTSYSERPAMGRFLFDEARRGHQRSPSRSLDDDPKRIFKYLEDYIITCFQSFECVNSSFIVHHPRYAARVGSEPIRKKPVPRPESLGPNEHKGTREHRDSGENRESKHQGQAGDFVVDLDPKMLLIGDFAENGTWWVGHDEDLPPPPTKPNGPQRPSFSAKSPQMIWGDLMNWYSVVTNAAEGWFLVYEELSREDGFEVPEDQVLQDIERDLLEAQEHTRRALLKATELLLKRPGRLLTDPADLRFLLIILENPLLHANSPMFRGLLQQGSDGSSSKNDIRPGKSPAPASGPISGQHSGIIKRIVGLISNSSIDCHNQLIGWLARFHPTRFVRVKDLVSGFLTYRLLRQKDRKQQVKVDITAGLIPQMQEGRPEAFLYDEFSAQTQQKKAKDAPRRITYTEDWQIKAASRVLALVFAANNLPSLRRGGDPSTANENKLAAVREGIHSSGQLLPTSDFYNSMLDYADLVADFETWEARRGRFSFCQYPFLLSISAKTRILEHDARRQMQSKARDAFFDTIMGRANVNQFLVLDIRRDCLVDDSLKAVSEVIGSGSEDVKKGLRINFKGEEGIDAGGLRKEWFLLLVREVFNPDHGMFVYDEDSQYCYFNPHSFETSDQFFLVGVVMGLAIYNSTILDVALPPFAFRKLIASAPSYGTGTSAHPKPAMRYTLKDLAEYRPRLAKGLRQLLDYEGDVETTFCLDFVIDTDRYGTTVTAPLCPGGDRMPVTNSNRRSYVDLYVRHVLDVAVKRQFEPFKRGFYTICGGNALSLFRPEEIELLVRGSDEALDISSLRAVAEYDNWGSKKPDGTEPIIDWFWETFQEATPKDQRKLLLFITGSDRIPAMGAAVLPIKISCLGEDSGRFPIARTCFNLISLWKYDSKEKLEKMLWTAVHESEGFGLK